jgi:hypothetical protein
MPLFHSKLKNTFFILSASYFTKNDLPKNQTFDKNIQILWNHIDTIGGPLIDSQS